MLVYLLFVLLKGGEFSEVILGYDTVQLSFAELDDALAQVAQIL